MFALTKQLGTLHWSPNTEKKGKRGSEAASTFWLEFDVPNTFLDQFDRNLRPALYRRPDDNEGDMADRANPQLNDPDYLPNLRLESMENEYIEVKGSMTGAILTFHIGRDTEDSNIEIEGTRFDKYMVKPVQGGTAHCKVRGYGKPDSVDFFYHNNHREYQFSITPPEAGAPPAQSDWVDEDEDDNEDGDGDE